MKTIPTFLLAACFIGSQAKAQQEANPMLANAQTFIDVPYVAHTLETDGEEDLVINCDEVDCTTFVEYVLALSLPSASGNKMSESDFAANLQRIRYREGKIDGYTSRLHYTSDWINNGVRGGFMEDVTAANSPYTQKLSLSYMSSHPELYKHLSNSPENVTKMAEYEKALSGQEIHWLPKDKLPVNGLPWIKSGDIIVLTTNIPGLDTAHMGIAIYVKDTLCLLHASSSRGKVLVDKLALSRLLDRNKKWTGIRVIRMKR
ncbi:N-acetylmuramoyl-L-alanine amidase-like domain-containing protein [Bacteroides salyersiae]|uniref:N-acetylmuramoyl-L-alanine amidase-like domain-containing protein n=1 Tax=Bacteroides salyersiae TaxID=291644 RepID=UPI0003A01C59|nr:N-acetylmuramoyl-L-alanine amidase-like domain-containing protein [Bacteroides salyersiae]MCS3060276.1 DUF1460 domain-containing protein [Bacteroides salyersiae]